MLAGLASLGRWCVAARFGSAGALGRGGAGPQASWPATVARAPNDQAARNQAPEATAVATVTP